MTNTKLPEPWQTWMRRAGLHSIRQLALAAQINHRTVSRAINSTAIPTDETVEALANTLGVPAADVYRATRIEASVGTPWTPPAESARMTHRQRRAADELIRAMVEATDRIPGRGGTPDWDPAASPEEVDPESLGLAAHTPAHPPHASQYDDMGEGSQE